MENNKSYDWVNLPSHIILDGVDESGGKLLKKFLLDYVELTGDFVNPSCPTCLNHYIKNYKKIKIMNTSNKCDYELQHEYNGIPLEFGSGINVTNDNITNEYGEILKERFEKLGTKPEIIFLKFPKLESHTAPAKTVVEPVKTDKPKTLKEVIAEVKMIEAEPETEKDLTPEQLLQALETEVKGAEVVSKDEVEDLEA